MKKTLFCLSALAATVSLHAQKTSRDLSSEFQAQKISDQMKFEQYWAKKTQASKNTDLNAAKQDRLSRLAFFMKGKPFYLKALDNIQILNANADALQNGTLSGLGRAYNGRGMEIFLFDGGRVYEKHKDFYTTASNQTTRVTNMEASTMNYSAHATNVTGIMGALGSNVTGTVGTTSVSGNTKGIAPLALFKAYSFTDSKLPGSNTTSDVYQKIVTAAPALSNHSYGINTGWEYNDADGVDYLESGWYYTGYYDTTADVNYDLQGTYYSEDINYDNIVRNNPGYIIVKAAGNSFGDGPGGDYTNAYYYDDNTQAYVQYTAKQTLAPDNCATGYDCIGTGSLAKNIIVVGATDKITTNSNRYTQASDMVHSFYSSAGPRDDGGIKPDVVSVGSRVFSPSTAEDTTGSQTFDYGSGTSYSSPNVTGIIGLWNELYKSLNSNATLNASKAKTLVIHSASEAGNYAGPDAQYGWGFVNAQRGAEIILAKNNQTAYFDDNTLSNGTTYTKTIRPATSGAVKVTISWVDPAGTLPQTDAAMFNSRTSKLVNDLDLRVIDDTGNITYLPWKLDINNLAGGAIKGDNTVDNVEQVVIDNAMAGRAYRIQVTHKGTLQNGTAQSFSIIADSNSGSVLAASETETAAGIQLYPTISSDVVNIVTPKAKATVKVYDTSGKLIRELKGSEKIALEVSGYANGIYIVNIETPTATVSKKFIKK